MSDFSGLMAAITKMAGPPEEIGGAKLDDVVQFVDLSIAYTPVVYQRPHDYMLDIPQPDRVKKDGLRNYLSWPERQEWQWLEPDQLKRMRARYLLLRGEYYRMFRGFSYPNQQKIIAWYFDGSMWRPEADSPLYKAMGLI